MSENWKVTPTGIVRVTGYWTLTLHQEARTDFRLDIDYSGPDKWMWPRPFATVLFPTPSRENFADDQAYIGAIGAMADRLLDAIGPFKREIEAAEVADAADGRRGAGRGRGVAGW